ncbi:MAG TPA: nuclear transport factor 2 family protein [Nitrososphaerales archaeon]|nr:nuclear transport factor 2 family protein [Nitrososphaerales archaeon]
MPSKQGKASSKDQSGSKEKIVKDFFQLIVQGRPKEGLAFFSSDCIQHNPYVKGGMDALLDAMAAMQKESPKYPDPYFNVKYILVDRDMAAVHTELLNSKSNPSQGGLRQVHLFRFGANNKIVEYWDITQTIQPDMPNAKGAF